MCFFLTPFPALYARRQSPAWIPQTESLVHDLTFPLALSLIPTYSSISHSVGQKSGSWPHLAALSAARASSGQDTFFVSPPSTPPAAYNARKLPSSTGRATASGGGGGGSVRGRETGTRRSKLRTTFAHSPPQEEGASAVSPAGRGVEVRGGAGRGEGQAFGGVNSAEEGYMSFAALGYNNSVGPE